MSLFIHRYAEDHYAVYTYAKCHYAKSHHAECHFCEGRVLSVTMLNVVVTLMCASQWYTHTYLTNIRLA